MLSSVLLSFYREKAKHMNTNVQKLIAALRSGEFEQTHGQLRDGDSYCCLGVACEIYKRETGEGTWESPNSDSFLGAPKFVADPRTADWSRYTLPNSVREWYGFQSDGGTFDDDGYLTCLTDLNDGGGATFEDIADVIESAPKGLFQAVEVQS